MEGFRVLLSNEMSIKNGPPHRRAPFDKELNGTLQLSSKLLIFFETADGAYLVFFDVSSDTSLHIFEASSEFKK